VFQVKITDGAYTQSYFISVLLNPDYVNITINQVFTTITSRGKIGWSKDGEAGGLGFAYNGDNLLYEGGLMIGTSPTAVSDCIRGTSSTGASDTDFVTVVTAHKVVPSVVSEFDVNGEFNDADASPVQKLLVRHNAYAWSSPGSSKFVIVEYIIHNAGTSTLNNLYAGIFADWDVDAATASTNRADYDAARMMGYTYNLPTTTLFAGIQLLTNTTPNFYAIDNVGAGCGGVDIASSAGFSKADKYTTLSTMRTQAGDSTSTGNDVCNVMSSGPFTIAANDSIKVAFALIAGDNLTDLQTSADTAYIRYNGVPIPLGISKTGIKNFEVYPNPATNSLNFMFSSNETESYTISLVNTLGQTVKVMATTAPSNATHKVSFDISDLATGSYMYKATSASGKSNTGKIMITH
ncbi:MAG TPA: T9SS type A sorting domain-containing protein, partial [Bacteroidia bacterium]|nr:T9SS type A sorting domain-containing protein [Bacteroidia bacterium]